MRSRPSGLTERLQSQDENQILSFLSRGMNHLEHIVSCLKEDDDVQIITIDNNSSPEIAVESILRTLEKINQPFG